MANEELDPADYVVGPDAEVSDIDLDEEEFILRDGTRLTEERAAEIEARVLSGGWPEGEGAS